MRAAFIIAMGIVLAFAMPAFASGDVSSAPPISCGNGVPGGVNCIAAKKDLKAAKSAFEKGVKLQDHQHPEEAFAQFDEAARLAPQNMQFLTAREVVKSQLVFNHVQRGNLLLLEDARMRAAAEFRAAVELDSDNQYARERLAEATSEMAPALPRPLPARREDPGGIHLEPSNERATFHYTGEVRGLFEQLSAAYGVKAQFDDSVPKRQVVFNVDD